MAVNNSTMLETIEEGLNEVFYDTYNMEMLPDEAKIEDIFNGGKSKKHAEYDLENRGVGRFSEKGEEEDIPEDDIEEKYKTTYTHVAFSNSVPVTYEQMEDQLYGLIKENVGEMGEAAQDTQYFNAFSILRNGFDNAYLGADGQPLFDTDHPRDFGGVLSNKLTGKLTPDTLDQGIQLMSAQKSHSGRQVRSRPKFLLVAPKNFRRAVEITEAELVPQSANNGPNVFSSKYQLYVKQSTYLGSIEGGNDDAWFLIGRKHKLKRFIRTPLMTWMTPWQQSRKMFTYYNAYYRESYGWSSPTGLVGSDGTTGSYN